MGGAAPGFLIDDGGVVWPATPETIARRTGKRGQSRSNAVLEAIGLGFIFVNFCPSGARIALRPTFVTRRAMSRLAVVIYGRNPLRIAISCDSMMSSWEVVIGAGGAIARIEALVAEERRPLPRPLLHSTRLPLEHCDDLDRGRLLPILAAWHERQARWEPELYDHLSERKLLQTMSISEQPCRSARLVVRHWGANLTTFGKDWVRIAPGRDVEDEPNAELGLWRAAMVRDAISDGVPKLRAMDLVFRRVDGALARLKYQRLCLPWRTSEGATLVTAFQAARRMFVLERAHPAN
ncbi:MAG TPA: hypothetical protein VND95_07990 [Stellaceae bacterium]|nr:hypothetical protein [Stellaceae bacterium]